MVAGRHAHRWRDHWFSLHAQRRHGQHHRPRPPTASASISAGVVTFTVTTTPGFTYQPQSKDNLADPTWINLGPATTATGAPLIITDNPGAQTPRFYRAVRTP